MSQDSKFPCPCCGFLSRSEENYGTYEICEICYWEDDPLQAKNPDFAGGANIPSLKEARKNFLKYGASSKEYINIVRKPFPKEVP